MGLGLKNNIRNLHEEFDNHKIMVIETVSALNKLLFFEKYWSTEQKHAH